MGAVVVIVSVVVVGLPPLGVTVCGLKLQLASAGKPLHAKLTTESNTYCGVTVNVTVPLCPAVIVSEVGLAEIGKCCGTACEDYQLLATEIAKFEKPAG